MLEALYVIGQLDIVGLEDGERLLFDCGIVGDRLCFSSCGCALGTVLGHVGVVL